MATRVRSAGAWLALVGQLAAGCASSAHHVASRNPVCNAASLRVERGPVLSGATGERNLTYAVLNTSSVGCRVSGHPRLALRNAAGTVLPFRFARSAGPYLAHRAPTMLQLRPNSRAYFVLTKYRCDLAVGGAAGRWRASSVQIQLPDQTRSVTLPTWRRSSSDLEIEYCTAPTDRVGDIVDVSALVSRIGDAR